jgi:hypothetical protein
MLTKQFFFNRHLYESSPNTFSSIVICTKAHQTLFLQSSFVRKLTKHFFCNRHLYESPPNTFSPFVICTKARQTLFLQSSFVRKLTKHFFSNRHLYERPRFDSSFCENVNRLLNRTNYAVILDIIIN